MISFLVFLLQASTHSTNLLLCGKTNLPNYRRLILCNHLRKQDFRIFKEQFTLAIRTFMQMETLTPALLNEMIEKIEVHSIEGKGKKQNTENHHSLSFCRGD